LAVLDIEIPTEKLPCQHLYNDDNDNDTDDDNNNDDNDENGGDGGDDDDDNDADNDDDDDDNNDDNNDNDNNSNEYSNIIMISLNPPFVNSYQHIMVINSISLKRHDDIKVSLFSIRTS
jgi:hypothetical protein